MALLQMFLGLFGLMAMAGGSSGGTPTASTLGRGNTPNKVVTENNEDNAEADPIVDGVPDSPASGTGSITGRYFSDTDSDQLDASGNDQAVQGAWVQLMTANADLVARTTTDTEGNYMFANVGEGQYFIRFEDPNQIGSLNGNGGFILDSGLNDAQDSDILRVGTAGNGNSVQINLSAGQNLANVDAGITLTAAEPPVQGQPDPVVVVQEPAPVGPDPVVVVNDPAPADPVVNNPVDPTPTTADQAIDTSGGTTTPIDVASNFSVAGGRVTTLQVNNHETVESIRIIDGPAHGNLTVNPDNTLALVLSHDHTFAGRINFSYEVSYTNGSTQVHGSSVNVQTTTQQQGWGEGNFYMLETDQAGDVVVEYGDNHREVHISGSPDALSLGDIAALEGLNTSQITQNWLVAHDEYGSNPDMALNAEAGMQLWYGITGTGTAPSSNWLLFERGYAYDNLGRVIDRGTVGEDPMHPIHITSYGSGAKPVLNAHVSVMQDTNENIVFSDVEITGGISAIEATNLMFDNVDITNDGSSTNMGLHFKKIDGATLHNSAISDVHIDQAPNGGSWAGNEMASGMLVGGSTGVLIEGSVFDHNGWEDDFQANLSTSGGLPPNMFSHNVYVDYNNVDVTFRDNISMQAASYGAHIRSGGFIEDNVFLDNNAAVDFMGGDFYGAGNIGSFTLFTDNVVTSAGYREITSGAQGARSMGVTNDGINSTLLDNIIAHLADPNNPNEVANKTSTQLPLNNKEATYYDDTIVYNWLGSGSSNPSRGYDQNTDGLDTSVLNQTTIQLFTQQLLGDPNATIPDLASFLRAQAAGALDDYVDADLIIDFFQTGFGLSMGDRLSPDVLRFVPNDLGDGIRWDNRLNWSTDDLPGSVAGDSVDLGGNWVNYGGTTSIQNLDFGSGGELSVSHGYLQVNGTLATGDNGAALNISNVGQFWTDGYTDTDLLDINVTGGRFANTGHVDGAVDMHISGNGQAILATAGATFDLRDGSHLNIDGDDTKVGFDGQGGDTAVLRLGDTSTLGFSTEAGQLGMIEEFRSGAFGDTPDVLSGVNLGSSTLALDLTGLTEMNATLIEVDEIIGTFENVAITGMGSSRDATVTINYDTDQVTLSVGQAGTGSGAVAIETLGVVDEFATQNSDGAALWNALTSGHGVYTETGPADPILDDEFLIAAE